MSVTLPLEIYDALEKGPSKEDARKVVHGLEETISYATEYKWATTRNEIIDEFRKETGELRRDIDFVKKDIDSVRKEKEVDSLKDDIDSLKKEIKDDIDSLRKEIDLLRKEFVTKELFEEKFSALRMDLEAKIGFVKADLKRVDMKLNFLIILVIIALTLMNPVVADLIKHLLGI